MVNIEYDYNILFDKTIKLLKNYFSNNGYSLEQNMNTLQFIEKTALNEQNIVHLSVGDHIEVIAKPGESYNLINSETGLTAHDIGTERFGDDLLLFNEENNIQVWIRDFWNGQCIQGEAQCFVILNVPGTDGRLGKVTITQQGQILDHLLAGEMGTLDDSEALCAYITSSTVGLFAGIHPVVWMAGFAAVMTGIIAAGVGDDADTANDPKGNTTAVDADAASAAPLSASSGSDVGSVMDLDHVSMNINNIQSSKVDGDIVNWEDDNAIRDSDAYDVIDRQSGMNHVISGVGDDQFMLGDYALLGDVDDTSGQATTILDFANGHDMISLDHGVFSGLLDDGQSLDTQLNSIHFAKDVPTEDVAQIIFKESTGELFYDADGSGSSSQPIHFATLANTVGLEHTDIYIV